MTINACDDIHSQSQPPANPAPITAPTPAPSPASPQLAAAPDDAVAAPAHRVFRTLKWVNFLAVNPVPPR